MCIKLACRNTQGIGVDMAERYILRVTAGPSYDAATHVQEILERGANRRPSEYLGQSECQWMLPWQANHTLELSLDANDGFIKCLRSCYRPHSQETSCAFRLPNRDRRSEIGLSLAQSSI
jgi:hypothetical protein